MNCVKAATLYLAWTMCKTDRREYHKDAYREHVNTCPACRAELDRDRAIAAEQPERLPVDALIEQEAQA